MKITTRISYAVDLFPELNVDVGHDGSAIIYGMDDVTVRTEELRDLAFFFNEIATDSIFRGAYEWEVSTPDLEYEADDDSDDEADATDSLSVFMFGDIDGESEDK